MKILYKFTVNKRQKAEEKTQNEDGSFTVRQVDKEVPIGVTLKHPSRRDREEISVVYNGEFGNAIKRGLQTNDVMRRSLLDSGGILAQKDLERADELLRLITVKENEIQQKTIEKEDTSKDNEDLQNLANEFERIERAQRDIFSRSVESHAQNKTIEWCVLNMSFAGEDPVFPGNTHESKLSSYYDFCDDEDNHSFELEVYNTATVVYYHHILSGKTGQEYFDELFA